MTSIITATIGTLFWNRVLGWEYSFEQGVFAIAVCAVVIHFLDPPLTRLLYRISDRLFGKVGA